MAKRMKVSKVNSKKIGIVTGLAVFIGLIGWVGPKFIGAATPVSNIEAESGTAATATVVTDSTASGNKAVKFTAAGDDTDAKCADLTNIKFCDDFDGTSGTYPDSSKWNVFTSGSSWGSQCWKKGTDTIAMDGQGHLKLSIINTGTTQCTNSYGDSSTYAGGGMDTSGKFTTKYGTIEIRAKISCANSIWGAFWMSTGTGPSWPQSGEIDIYELGYEKLYRIQQTIHVGTSSSDHKQVANYADLATNQRWCDAYHVYGINWRQNSIKFIIDGTVWNEVTPSDIPAGYSWPFNTYDLRLLIDQQYGKSGTWTGTPQPSQLPTSTLVDYVRIYN